MEWNPETLEFLSKSFLDTLSLQPEPRGRAEKNLSDAADTPNYGIAVLCLVAEPSVDEQIRQCAALNFKNQLKTRWVPTSSTPISDGEKEEIKTVIVPVMLSATPKIQARLREALVVIGNHDFPKLWPALLPELKSGIETAIKANDFASVNGILATLDVLFKKFRYQSKSKDVLLDLKYCVDNFAAPLLFTVESMSRKINAAAWSVATLQQLLEAQILCCRIFYSLNFLDVPDKFEEEADEWFKKFLTVAIEDGGDSDNQPENITTHYVEKGEELVQKHLDEFVEVTKSLLAPIGERLTVSAIKFLTMLHGLLPIPVAMALVGNVVRLRGSDANTVHSYTAFCMKKLLCVKDKHSTSLCIGPIFPVLLTHIFGALEKPGSEENEYIMRCTMRVLQTADILLSPELASSCITELTVVLDRVCENHPKTHPVFSYFLFEALATLVTRACEKDPCLVPAFETCLLPSLQMILAMEVTELYPYAFPLIAQLVDLNGPPTPPQYLQLYDMLLTPLFWKNSASVPALVRLLQSFLQQTPNELLLNREGQGFRHLLGGIFNKLVSSPSTEEEGFRILNTVIENVGYDVIAEYMNHIWASLFTRLQDSKTPDRFVGRVIIFMSLFLVKHGIQALVDLVDSVEANLFHVILGKFWIPNLKSISTGYNYTEVKLSAVASTKLLYESASLLDPAAEELWGKLLDAIVTLLSQLPEEERAVPQVPGFDHQAATFVRLHNAGFKNEDPLKEIKDPKHFLVAFPANLSSEFRGRFPLVIMRYLSAPNQTALVKLCKSYNIAVV